MPGLFTPPRQDPVAVDVTPEWARPLGQDTAALLRALLAQGFGPAPEYRELTEAARGAIPTVVQLLSAPENLGPYQAAADYERRIADEAMRKWAGMAQKAGALASTDYLRGQAELGARLGEQLGRLRYQAMHAAPGMLATLGGVLTGTRGERLKELTLPSQLAISLLGSSRGTAGMPQYGKSPFAEIFGILTPFLPFPKIG